MLTINAPTWIEFLIGQSAKIIVNESKVHQKCGRPISSKGKNPIKKKAYGIIILVNIY
jgi:hypothetical protein